MNYVHLNEGVLVAGIVVKDLPTPTSAARKRRRTESESSITSSDLRHALERARSLDAEAEQQLDAIRDHLLSEYTQSEQYRMDALAELKDLVEQAVFQSHDFFTLLVQIRNNVLTIFELRYPGEPAEEVADRPELENEGAIYFAAEMMLAKMDATRYLREPNLALGRSKPYTLHRFVTKYAKIYKAFAAQRGIDLFIAGKSFGQVEYLSEAVGTVLHAILDNAVKYSPSGSRINIVFEETEREIGLRVESLGPRIEPSEKQRIFTVGYQGRAAAGLEAAGTGFGLAAAKSVSDLLNLDLKVKQHTKANTNHPDYYETTFSVMFDKVGSE